MFSPYTIDATSQRMEETRRAILAQRAYISRLDDPVLKAIAARTLMTLEDMLLIMRRTHGLLVETTELSDPAAPPDTTRGAEAGLAL